MVLNMAHPRDLERLYDEHAQALFAYLLNFTRNEADTRDVLQEVFIRLAREPDLLDEAREPRAFLLRLAHNLAVDRIRRRHTRGDREERWVAERLHPFASTSDPDEAAFREALTDALAELPPDQRAVVHLKLWEGLTFDAIAALLEIPLNTAASRYRYGIDKLQARLRPLYDELQ
jgi:RNA polymerase sigma-70 factor (ECF subfamily)